MSYGADVCTGGTASAESIYSGTYPASKAFDNDVTEFAVWNSATSWAPTEWIKYDLGAGVTKIAAQYTILPYDNGTACYYYPTAWKFQGSNDDAAWTDIDEQTGQSYTKDVKNVYNSFSNSTAYRYYRWLVSATGGGTTYVVITELEIMELDAVAPTVTTQDATSVSDSGCTGNGNITATGGANATRRGFCYMEGTSGDPTTANSTAYDDGSFGTGAYTKAITGLNSGTGYRVRAYAVNSAGTSYGSTVQITTTFILSINNGTHALTSDNLTLTTEGGEDISLMIANTLHALSSDNLDLFQAYILAIQNATHALSSDNISFSGGVQIAGAAPFTVHEMEHLIRTELNEPSTAILSSAEILSALNDGYRDVASLGLGIENLDIVFTKPGERILPYYAHRVNFIYEGEAFFGGGGGGGGGGWWQEAISISGNSTYISVMARDSKQLNYFMYNTQTGAWNLLGSIMFPKVINGVNVTSTAGYQGMVNTNSDFVVFVNDVYTAAGRSYLVSVIILKSKVVNTSLITAANFQASEKTVVAYINGTILIAYSGTSGYPKVSKSEDFGVTWNEISVASANDGRDTFLVLDETNDILYIATQYNVYKSTDQGDTWSNTATGYDFGYFDICFGLGSLWVVGGAYNAEHTLWKFANGVFVSSSTILFTTRYPNITSTTDGLVVYEPHYEETLPHGPWLLASADGVTWIAVVDLSVYEMPYPYNTSLTSDGSTVTFVACGQASTVNEFRLVFNLSADIFNWKEISTPVSWYVPAIIEYP